MTTVSNWKKWATIMQIGVFIVFLMPKIAKAQCDDPQKVIINEIAWAGTPDSSNDEWIELYNPTCASINLEGWKIEDDETSVYEINQGIIEPEGYFIIEDNENAIKTLTSDIIINLSLANSGDKLVLKNKENQTMDDVNTSGGPWFAGDNSTKGTMEKIDPLASGNDQSNWKTAILGNGHQGNLSSPILGTPKAKNSVSFAQQEIAKVTLKSNKNNYVKGEKIILETYLENGQNLFSYGFSLDYDPTVVQYQQTEMGTFLNNQGQDQTTFQAGLENQNEGRLLVGEARLNQEQKTGISGSGLLFKVTFLVVSNQQKNSPITFGEDSFLSTPENDVIAEFEDLSIEISPADQKPLPPQNVQYQEGTSRYSIKLRWQSSDQNPDGYKIFKKNPLGQFVEKTTLNGLEYIDNQEIIPNQEYLYQIVAFKGEQTSDPIQITAKDSRGIKGDTDRSDRIDGRDLNKIARAFGAALGSQNYDPKIDFNYDGRIDGLDLIEMSANWGQIFQ